MCLIAKAQKGRHSTVKREPVENWVPSTQTSLCLPMTYRWEGHRWQSLENLRDLLTTQLSQTAWQPSLAGSYHPARDHARLCSTAWGLPRAPSDIRCSVTESRHCPPTMSPQTKAIWPVTLLPDPQPPLSTPTFTLAMPKRNTTTTWYSILSAMLDDFVLSP